MLMSWLGTAVIAAVAVPAAHVLAKQPDQVTQLTQAFLLYAPGVAGFSLVVAMSRVIFALGRLRAAGIGLVAGPAAADRGLRPAGADGAAAVGGRGARARLDHRPARGRGADGVRGPAAAGPGRGGLGHATAAGITAGAIGSAVGVAVTLALPAGGKLFEAAVGALAAALALLAFGIWAYALDRGDLRMVARRLRRFARPRS